MREHDISQVPVIEGGEVVGSISETRILDILVSDPSPNASRWPNTWRRPFPVISEDASLEEIAHNMDHADAGDSGEACSRFRHHHEVRSDLLPDEAERRQTVGNYCKLFIRLHF